RHLGNDGPGHGSRQYAESSEQRSDIAALHITHGDEQESACVADVIYRDDIRVVNGRCCPRLADEPCPDPASLASSGARIFRATRRSGRSSWARKTTAMPPRPICSSSRSSALSAPPLNSALATLTPR